MLTWRLLCDRLLGILTHDSSFQLGVSKSPFSVGGVGTVGTIFL